MGFTLCHCSRHPPARVQLVLARDCKLQWTSLTFSPGESRLYHLGWADGNFSRFSGLKLKTNKQKSVLILFALFFLKVSLSHALKDLSSLPLKSIPELQTKEPRKRHLNLAISQNICIFKSYFLVPQWLLLQTNLVLLSKAH